MTLLGLPILLSSSPATLRIFYRSSGFDFFFFLRLDVYLVVVLLTEKGEGDAGKNNTADYAWGDRPTD